MRTSDDINELSAALAKAQGALANPPKDRRNPHFNSDYADLTAGLKVIRPAIAAHGLSVVQMTRVNGDMMLLDTRLLHSSGQWIECEYPVCKVGIPPQQVGSALTYARRYALFSLVGIAGENDDDDGNGAQNGNGNARSSPAAEPAYQSPDALRAQAWGLDHDQIAHIERELRDTESDRGAFLKRIGAPNVETMTVEQYKTACALFAKKREMAMSSREDAIVASSREYTKIMMQEAVK